MDKKLAADASFFWECAKKHQEGKDIRGASGHAVRERDAEALFGGASPHPTAGIAFDKYEEIPVSRAGLGASEEEVPPLGGDFSIEGRTALPPFALRNLLDGDRMGIRNPTPIQKHCVPLALSSFDIMACAQTGSGKTVAFLLPLISSIAGDVAAETLADGSSSSATAVADLSAEAINALTVAGLKEELSRRGLKVSGLKAELQERLIDACSGGGNGGGNGSGNGGPPPAMTAKAVREAGADTAQRQRGVTGRLSPKEEEEMRRRGTPARPTALVLAPTRELAMQIEIECAKLTCDAPPPPSGASNWCSCAYGGATARPQLEALARGVEILVATPGRLVDFVNRDLVSLADCRFLVLDEADRMLDMGFEPQIRRIVERHDLPPKEHRQTLLFSATFAPPIQKVAAEYLREPFAHVTVGKVGSSIEQIKQRLVLSRGSSKQSKLALLKPLLTPDERTIVFVQKKHVARWVREQLAKDGIQCGEIHGDRSQGQREAALARFREGSIAVLVATDVASRGIDVPEVAHVIQFDLPVSRDEMDSYVHRIGRTGRAGRSGRATAFFVPGNEPKVGNGPLWPDLARLFDDNGQELPSWFDECRPAGAQPRRALGAPTAAPTAAPTSSRRRGASDNRRARRAAQAAAMGRPPNAGAPPVMRRRPTNPSMTALRMRAQDYEEDRDELDDARDFQPMLPFLIQLVPIGLAYVAGTVILPALVWPASLAVLAFFVVANTFDEDDGP